MGSVNKRLARHGESFACYYFFEFFNIYDGKKVLKLCFYLQLRMFSLRKGKINFLLKELWVSLARLGFNFCLSSSSAKLVEIFKQKYVRRDRKNVELSRRHRRTVPVALRKCTAQSCGKQKRF